MSTPDGEFNKVFGIGLSKTGTTSLGMALNQIGVPVVDFPHDPCTLSELERGHYKLSILDTCRGATDIPVATYYAQLDALYPGSRFILTVRDEASWLKSVEDHWQFVWEWAERHIPFHRFCYFMHAATYGCVEFSPDRFRFVLHQHTENVKRFFADRPDDLLILNVCEGEGYEKLCPFLGMEGFDAPFPRANTREEKKQRRQWIAQHDRAREELVSLIGVDDPVILLDEGQLGGTTFEASRPTIPFPEADGQFAGRLACDEDAIKELSRLIAEHEPAYLVVAWPAFWWLDHYQGLRDHLERHHPRVHQSEQLAVFRLAAD